MRGVEMAVVVSEENGEERNLKAEPELSCIESG